MKARPTALTLAVALVAFALAGCAPASEPEEPTPAFTSEADAFAAAEETYRAYVDALNRVDLSDPATFEDVYAWTTGDFNANERTTLSQMHADRWSVGGQTVIVRLDHISTTESLDTVVLGACADVSSVTLVDSEGSSMVNDARPDVQSTLVSIESSASSPTGYLVADIVGDVLEPPCPT